jgi:hypothetical protein
MAQNLELLRGCFALFSDYWDADPTKDTYSGKQDKLSSEKNS